MKNLMMGQVTMNVSTMSEDILHPDVIVAARIILVMPNGQEVEMNVDEVLEMDMQNYDIETGLPVFNETDLNL